MEGPSIYTSEYLNIYTGIKWVFLNGKRPNILLDLVNGKERKINLLNNLNAE